ncbi:MAG: hypothetical protein FJ013_00355 [Chloroflexi bacterium]|nr:hypothetical protein [Chloroflexota bacterium]
MAAKLIGADDATIVQAASANYVCNGRFQAEASGNMTEFRLKCSASGNVKVAIYSDAGSKLNAVDTSTAVVEGWNTIPFPSTSLTSGTYYKLAFNSSTDCVGALGTGTGTSGYEALDFSNNMPDTITGSGWTRKLLIAGWAQNLAPSGIASAEAIGSHTLTLLLQFLTPTGIDSAETFGSHTLTLLLQFLTPTGIDSAEAIGSHAISTTGSLAPIGIASLESFGAPTVVRFTYHPIVAAIFAATSPDTNRFYVVARDSYGNPVYGSAINSAEVALLGERLDFQVELSVPTTDLAGSVAAAMIAKRRLDNSEAQIVITPHCGVELWDVVQVTDTPTAQASAIYRVSAIRFEYLAAARKPRLTHTLTLSTR